MASTVADYRASVGLDMAHDRADRDSGRTLEMPVTVMQQDWGAALGCDAAVLWGAWAPDLNHLTFDGGHFMAEENPGAVSGALRELMKRLGTSARRRLVGFWGWVWGGFALGVGGVYCFLSRRVRNGKPEGVYGSVGGQK
ncbi:hypothetical protein ABIE37_004503 [Arthrobacter bambusae]|uniref:AB hydrolase-1 domain-containing protein n=1 Tax=Arthrobacter bambusae TaxID=1338426 RepID=A0ABV2PD15_9MICC